MGRLTVYDTRKKAVTAGALSFLATGSLELYVQLLIAVTPSLQRMLESIGITYHTGERVACIHDGGCGDDGHNRRTYADFMQVELADMPSRLVFRDDLLRYAGLIAVATILLDLPNVVADQEPTWRTGTSATVGVLALAMLLFKAPRNRLWLFVTGFCLCLALLLLPYDTVFLVLLLMAVQWLVRSYANDWRVVFVLKAAAVLLTAIGLLLFGLNAGSLMAAAAAIALSCWLYITAYVTVRTMGAFMKSYVKMWSADSARWEAGHAQQRKEGCILKG